MKKTFKIYSRVRKLSVKSLAEETFNVGTKMVLKAIGFKTNKRIPKNVNPKYKIAEFGFSKRCEEFGEWLYNELLKSEA